MNNENESRMVDLPRKRDEFPRRRVTASKIPKERIRDLRNYSIELNERLRIEKNKKLDQIVEIDDVDGFIFG